MANAYKFTYIKDLNSTVQVIFDSSTLGIAGDEFVIKEIRFTNTSSNEIFIDCSVFDGGDDVYLAKTTAIPVGASLNVVDNVLTLTRDDGFDLRGLCSLAASCDVAISYMVIT